MYSSPPFAKRVAVIPWPSSFPIASTVSKLLLIFVVPKYKVGASLRRRLRYLRASALPMAAIAFSARNGPNLAPASLDGNTPRRSPGVYERQNTARRKQPSKWRG